MTNYVVLRHNFDVHRNPDRLGPLYDDEKFCLVLNGNGGDASSLVGNALWLVSWEGFMKTHHVICGWFIVDHVGKRQGVVAQTYVSGNEGELFARGIGPLDMHPWFHKFVEAHRKFRDGVPTEAGEYLDDLHALARGAGYRLPTGAGAGSAARGPASP